MIVAGYIKALMVLFLEDLELVQALAALDQVAQNAIALDLVVMK